MKPSKTTLKELTARYRAVLFKCALMNAALFFGIGRAAAADLVMTGNDAIVNEDGTLVYDSVSMADSARMTLTRDELHPTTVVQTSFFTMTGNTALISTNTSVQTDNLIMRDRAVATGDSLFYASAGNIVAVLTGHARVSSTRAPFANGAYITMRDYASIGVTSAFYMPNYDVCPSLTMSGNAALTANGNFTMNNGTVTMSDNASIVAAGFGMAATNIAPSLTMSGNAVLSLHNTFRMEGANVTLSGNAGISSATQENVSSTHLTVNGRNTLYADTGTISFTGSSSLTVAAGATLTVYSQNNAVTFDGTSSLILSGTLNGRADVYGGTVVFNSAAARLTGALHETPDLTFNDDYVFGNINAANATPGTVTIAAGKTLDIGENRITATLITGGTLQATLTDAAKDDPIIQAAATNVTLVLNMDAASRNEVTLYHITGAVDDGFTFGEYNTGRYAVSDEAFTVAEAKTIGVLSDAWRGGDLYILLLETSGEAAIEDLIDQGIPVSVNERNAIAALDNDVVGMLAPAQKAAAQRINDLLDAAAGNAAQVKQLLREVAPEAAPSASSTATANAGAVMNVVGGRMGGGSPAPAAGSGRSGGDYTAGALTAWAQMMYNKAELKKADGFDADSTGFAAGLEYAVNEDVKAGFGYAFTATDLATNRSKTDVDTHTGFVYGEYKPDAFYVNGVMSYGHSKYDETTRLAGLKSDYRADTFAMQAMAGYAVNDILTPEAGVRYTNVRQKSYVNALGARLAGKTTDTLTWVAGVKAVKTFRKDSLTLTPDAKLALTYDAHRSGQSRTVALANGSSYVADGENMDRFGVELGAGVTFKVGGNTDIGVSYEGKFKKHYTDHTALLNVRYNF